jgi:hypothetical protein
MFSDEAEARWNAVPAEVRDEIESMVTQMRIGISGPETSDSFDHWVNQWLRPYGLCQLTTWNPVRRSITTQMTTLEALAEMAPSEPSPETLDEAYARRLKQERVEQEITTLLAKK